MTTTIIQGSSYRISLLTDRLCRLEYQEEGLFEDRPSQAAMERDFPPVAHELRREGGRLIIETSGFLLSYDEKVFSTNGLCVTVKSTGESWRYSDVFGNTDENLYGTARTLDKTDGIVDLEEGIFGRKGFALLDESSSPVYDGENFHAREREGLDLYFFGFGRDFFGGLRDFYALSGKAPMLPRYALGNWWSRFTRYTEESYLALLDDFLREGIPLSVAVIDMDWHLTKVDARFGTGWTGYTWDPECFPDPARFLQALHGRGLAASLNLHPADGVRAFESMYEKLADRCGIDPETEAPVEHDLEREDFRKAYFEEIMHPYEDMGVDFWWIDWQQGRGKGKNVVDPLLLLNHWHYTDQKSRGKRAMIFSRYAGVGSHRYPLGFSGDTYTTWRSLKLQPYFTSTASNIGYGVWSHDIGGHMLGDRDDERFVRWVQFGVFSPVMRLHSCGSPFIHREPWAYKQPYRQILGDFLRLRHQMLPYLYTAMREAHEEDRPLVCPVYYSWPDEEAAYEVPESYTFGKSLLIGAVTEPMDQVLRRAGVSMYIPEGRWVDLFSGQIYQGAVKRKLYRTLETIPALLRAGGILPLAGEADTDAFKNPKSLRIYFGAGADGEYTLYEDDGLSQESESGNFVETKFSINWMEEGCEIRILPPSGALSLIPEGRRYELILCGAEKLPGMRGMAEAESGDGSRKRLLPECEEKTGFLRIDLGEAADGAIVKVEGLGLRENDARKEVLSLIDEAYIENRLKETLAEDLQSLSGEAFLKALEGRDVPEILKDAIRENYTGKR